MCSCVCRVKFRIKIRKKLKRSQLKSFNESIEKCHVSIGAQVIVFQNPINQIFQILSEI